MQKLVKLTTDVEQRRQNNEDKNNNSCATKITNALFLFDVEKRWERSPSLPSQRLVFKRSTSRSNLI